MKRETCSGILLIVAALTGVLVMALHPTVHSMLAPGQLGRQAHLNGMVHGVALASTPLLFVGLLGLLRRLGGADLAVAALAVHGFALVAVMTAAVASGFVATEMVEQLAGADPASQPVYQALLDYTGAINQGFAKVHVVAGSIAILLWSAAMVRTRAMSRVAANVGFVVGGAVLLAFLGGHLRLNVHGFGIVVALQAVWLIWVGALLLRGDR